MAYQLCVDTVEEWSKKYHGQKFHAVLCDPPYGLKFMGKDWDVVSAKEWGEALLPHLYPGALVLMFGGTRTWHKLATGMEDAGFEMWDTLMWLYGQGFPKGQDISRLIDKNNGDTRATVGQGKGRTGDSAQPHGGSTFSDDNYEWPGEYAITAAGSAASAPWSGHKTCALKPAWEPILAFRVPTKENYASLALTHGSGALNIDGSRIATTDNLNGGAYAQDGSERHDWCRELRIKREGAAGEYQQPSGRYPANVLLECTCDRTEIVDVKPHGSVSGNEPSHTGGDNTVAYGEYKRVPFTAHPGVAVVHTNPDCPAALLDAQSGCITTKRIEKPSNCVIAGKGDVFTGNQFPARLTRGARGHSDSGGASRFFYCAKASQSERNAGVEKNMHPTVKPVALIQYLATLLLPPSSVSNRRLLVPFAGSGSEMIGALKAGWDEVIGVEQKEEYAKIAEGRLAHAAQNQTNAV